MNTDKRFDIVAEVKVTLTTQDVDDIMSAALDGGICYWCREAEVIGEYLGEYASEQIARGGALMLHDAESEEAWPLTMENFAQGFKRYLEEGCHVAVEDNRIDTCDLDANDADCIIQLAIFGEVVFG